MRAQFAPKSGWYRVYYAPDPSGVGGFIYCDDAGGAEPRPYKTGREIRRATARVAPTKDRGVVQKKVDKYIQSE